MQNYHDLQNTEAANVYLDKVKDNIQAVASNFSGTSFPTENLQEGMLCYRTDEKKLYQLTNTYPITWESVQSSLTFDTTPTAGSTNPVTSNGIYNSLQNLVTKEYVNNSGTTIVNNIPFRPIPVDADNGSSDIIFKNNSDVGVTSISSIIGPYVKKEIKLATSNSNIDLSEYAKKTDLANYVTSDDVSASLTQYAKKSDLTNYVTSSDVSASLTQYAKKTDVPAVTVSGNTISFGNVTIGVD